MVWEVDWEQRSNGPTQKRQSCWFYEPLEQHADGRMLVSASDDKLVKMWSVKDAMGGKGQSFLQTFSGHQNWAKTAEFSADSRMVASGGDDRTVRIWDVTTGHQIHEFLDHTGMVNKVQFHPDSTCIASCANDKKIKIFDVRSHRLLQHYDAHDGAVNSIAFNAAGSHLLSTGNDGVVKLWDLRRGCILYTLFGHEPVPAGARDAKAVTTAAAFSPASDYFVSGGTDCSVLCWSTALNPVPVEDLMEIKGKLQTEVFITEKEKVDKLPSSRGVNAQEGKKKKRGRSKMAKSPERTIQIDDEGDSKKKNMSPAKRIANGITYRKLRPEVKMTLEKIVYQLELVGKTLQVLEQRVIDSEDKLQTVMQAIKSDDIHYVSTHMF